MYETTFVIFVGMTAAIVGLLLGAGLHRRVGSSATKVRSLKKALEEAEKKNSDYQRHVAEHFSETASLLNGLTRQYKNIHDHLADGAEQLCRDPSGQSLLAGAAIELTLEERNAEQHNSAAGQPHIQPPLDYAPKAQASKSGTLSEEYGLEKVKLHEQNAAYEGDSSIGQFAPNGTPANDQSAQPKGPPNLSTA